MSWTPPAASLGCLVEGTLIATPSGQRPVESLAAGDALISWDEEALVPQERRIAAVHRHQADHLVRLEAGAIVLRGATPDHLIWDAFESIWRAAASVAPLCELLVWDGEARSVEVTDVIELEAPGSAVIALELEGPERCFFADGALVRHRAVEGRA